MTQPGREHFPDRVTRTPADMISEALHELPYGVYIIGSNAGGEPNGMIADWVMQVSFAPTLVAVAFENDASTLAAIRGNRAFTVNLLKQENRGMEFARQFVQPRAASKVRGRSEQFAAREQHKLAGVEYELTEAGCPILAEALAWLSCEAQDFVPAGDHTLVIGRVVAGERIGEGEPLTSTYTGWTYSGTSS